MEEAVKNVEKEDFGLNNGTDENKHSITIENFEGPLDLLCFLISKNKMDIFDISLSEITDNYLEFLFQMQELDLDIATEFLIMASNLLYIKSKKLIPAAEPEEELEDEMLTEEELLNRIIEYKKYKERLEDFKEMYKNNFGSFEKYPEKIKLKRELDKSILLDLDCIYNIYISIKENQRIKINEKLKDVEQILTSEKVTIKSKIRQIIEIFKKKSAFVFGKMYDVKKDKKIDVVTAFISVLELSRLKHVSVNQKEMFGDIIVKKENMSNLDISLIKE